ncbi:MAG: (d)CMP kinase [Bacteroides graminisolvens]|jgi:cytidylate kinase|uniref:(d)CMP kinase n=1 Tax=Bacteroides graminisolvens TaxID=477666 RepID=UPI0003FBAC68|nr:(d)CMP kinase [Bacteroides graminisolvens]MBP6062097.1 (d)CMP kinase [Bacteroides sp.]MBP6140106.1 (d)CMP kinase [Bacteroides sp.]MBP6248764.1 (d)CMP kinase [Bacteroides sp.]MBP7293378.1 (d)CMP kinase [Bacteroides sp.]MBP9495622.1 (d)CMP kinase [Bacteroides sp.]
MKKITIAIDGFSSCGKSTMAKSLAKEIGYIYIDSGAMYRAVTLYCIENGLIEDGEIRTEILKEDLKRINISFKINAETGQPDTYLNAENVENKIRTMLVSSMVSQVSALDFVRSAMVEQQQKMGKEKGIVMDGRDIGTTVFPDAELKIFVTASAEVRAQRRFDELKSKGQEASYDEILHNVKQRDYLDQNREVSPLRQASDAILLDNSTLTIEEQKAWLINQFNRVVNP